MKTPRLLLGLLLSTTALAQQPLETSKVAGRVHLIVGRGGNIAVSTGPDGVLMVDDKFAPLAEQITAEIARVNPDGGPLAFVLNTHYHGDHTGGNPIFGKIATIIAHDNVRRRVATPQVVNGNRTEPLPPEGLPVITYAEGLTLHFNGEEIRVRHVANGHTDGDSIVHFVDSKVVHLGDLYFNGMFPFVDLDHGGNVQNLARQIGRLLDELPADVRVIPGHGPLSDIEELRRYHAMLNASVKLVRDQLAAGSKIDAIQQAGLPESLKPWGNGFIKPDRWLETIATSLIRENEVPLTP